VRDEHYFLIDLQDTQQAERQPKELQFVPDWVGWEEALAELTFEAEKEWVRRARRVVEGTSPFPSR
jgi:hypothetical protein